MREEETPIKRRVGKPSKGNDARNKCITLKVSVNEIAEWRKEAVERGVTFSEFVLGPLRRYTARKKKRESE